MSALIETILLRYPIPELYLQEGLSPTNGEQYVIIDGQQRVSTVLEYLGNRFRLDRHVDAQFAGLKFSQLDPKEQRQILTYQFVVRVLPSDWGEERLREVFSRLNRGVSALNDQELRHATYWGPFIKCMESIAADTRWEDIRLFTAAEIRRMGDVEFISELAVGLIHGFQNKKDTLDQYYLAYEEHFEQEADVKQSFDSVLQIVQDVMGATQSRRWKKKSDFYTLFLFVARTLPDWASLPARQRLADALDQLASRVDVALSRIGAAVSAVTSGETANAEPSVLEEDHPAVSEYVLAVRGAASDLSARKARDSALEKWVNETQQK